MNDFLSKISISKLLLLKSYKLALMEQLEIGGGGQGREDKIMKVKA